MIVIVSDIFFSSSILINFDKNWTELILKPKLVRLAISVSEDCIKPIIPKPMGPRVMAMNLDFIIPIITTNTCTPPKIDVAEKTSL